MGAVAYAAAAPPVLVALLAGAAGGLAASLLFGPSAESGPAAPPPSPSDADVSLADVVKVMELPAVVLNANLHVTSHNDQAVELFPNIAPDLPLSQLSRHPDLLSAISKASEDGLARVAELVDHLPRGRRLRVYVASLKAGQEPARLLLQFRDLSEQDLLAQMRSDFIANASHELRTPLASVRGFIETLQGPAANDTAAREKFLSIMSAQAQRMTRILDDLLSLSRIEMRAHVPPTATVQLDPLLREVTQSLEPLAKDAGIAVTLALPQSPLAVRGDRDELMQVFQNLIQNAIKYGYKDGNVTVTLQREHQTGKRTRAVAIIADDGPGIAAEHLPRLTERFYRVDTATSREKGGTGLGLAIVKHILNRHEGRLEIEAAELVLGRREERQE